MKRKALNLHISGAKTTKNVSVWRNQICGKEPALASHQTGISVKLFNNI